MILSHYSPPQYTFDPMPAIRILQPSDIVQIMARE